MQKHPGRRMTIKRSSEEMLTRFGIRRRGYSAKIDINVTVGRPSFRHVVVEGASLVLGARSEAVE